MTSTRQACHDKYQTSMRITNSSSSSIMTMQSQVHKSANTGSLDAVFTGESCKLQGSRWDGYLAGVVVREMQLSILRADSREQKCPSLLADAVVIVWPVGWSGLQQ